MKIRENAYQQNFVINNYFYTNRELMDMYYNMEGVTCDNQCPCWDSANCEMFRICADVCKEVKVVCRDGWYTNCVVTKKGDVIFIDCLL